MKLMRLISEGLRDVGKDPTNDPGISEFISAVVKKNEVKDRLLNSRSQGVKDSKPFVQANFNVLKFGRDLYLKKQQEMLTLSPATVKKDRINMATLEIGYREAQSAISASSCNWF